MVKGYFGSILHRYEFHVASKLVLYSFSNLVIIQGSGKLSIIKISLRKKQSIAVMQLQRSDVFDQRKVRDPPS
jgi:hypothetical protein